MLNNANNKKPSVLVGKSDSAVQTFTIQSNSSNVGAQATLTQAIQDRECIIAYA